MKRASVWALILFAAVACSRLPTLTPELLSQAEQKWNAQKPASYRLIVEMSGDRVEAGRFEVEVHSGEVVSLRRNGLVVSSSSGQDYTMDGLFRMLRQEIALAEKPEMLGAPGGYSVYMNASFDEMTGRLLRYRRTVGGTSNSIEVNVAGYFSRPLRFQSSRP